MVIFIVYVINEHGAFDRLSIAYKTVEQAKEFILKNRDEFGTLDYEEVYLEVN